MKKLIAMLLSSVLLVGAATPATATEQTEELILPEVMEEITEDIVEEEPVEWEAIEDIIGEEIIAEEVIEEEIIIPEEPLDYTIATPSNDIRPTADPNFIEMGLEDYLEAVEKGEIVVPPAQSLQGIVLSGDVSLMNTNLEGWVQSGGYWTYWENGEMLRNTWKWITGSSGSYWYYFNNLGQAVTGWLLDAGDWYYLREAGDDGGPECSMARW